MAEYQVNFSPNQKLPDGYNVVYDDDMEKYYFKSGDIDGLIWADRWGAYRNAWAHYRSSLYHRRVPTENGIEVSYFFNKPTSEYWASVMIQGVPNVSIVGTGDFSRWMEFSESLTPETAETHFREIMSWDCNKGLTVKDLV